MAAESEKLFLLKVMNEQQQIADERQKFSASKRYDPKYRALTEAIRLMEEEEGVGDGDDVGDGEGDDGRQVRPAIHLILNSAICRTAWLSLQQRRRQRLRQRRLSDLRRHKGTEPL